MSSETEKSELLNQFQEYLEQSNLDSFSANNQPDLNSLLSELVALKSEVKAESRQFKNTLDTLSSALDTLQDDNKRLSKELDESTQRLELHKDDFSKTMLLELVNIYDRLSDGMDILQAYQPVKSIFRSSREQDIKFIGKFSQGQRMTLSYFDQLFKRYQVRKIDCIGERFDPTTMNATETISDKRTDDGVVLEELRTGFLYKNNVLRLAEVKVNSVKIL